MSVLYIVVPLALLVVGAALWAFVWASSGGQFDDLDTPALRMLRDDSATSPTATPERSPTEARPGETAAPE